MACMYVWYLSPICIAYLVLRLDVGPLLQEEVTGGGVALFGCRDEGRRANLQYQRDRDRER